MMSIGEVAFSSIGLSWNTRNQNEDVSVVESSGGSEAGGIRLNFGAPRKLEGGFFGGVNESKDFTTWALMIVQERVRLWKNRCSS